MTLDERTEIINKISRTMSIMMCDIKLHQSMNIFSINIHSEDFFANLFNFLEPGKQYKNGNAASYNEAYVDLVDHNGKRVMQITSTTGSGKIDKSLKILDQDNYLQYEFELYFLLDKPKNLQKETIEKYKNAYGIVDIRDHLKDFSDILNEIKSLSDKRLEEVYRLYFRDISEKYTDEISLQIVFEALIKDKAGQVEDYSEDFDNEDLDVKISFNSLTRKVGNKLHEGNEAALTIYELDDKDLLTSLRELIVDDFYAKLLKSALQKLGVHPRELANKTVLELHQVAAGRGVCFNKLLGDLCQQIKNMTFDANYREISMAWVIISFFFDECDIGLKK
ncbi:SMEK domain-containing protein [Vibrio diabolicus]|uniref:SMEK domain-containing protein n=1 Tax=Vibrio diabolicus TaxID=50719 RepID=UPI00247FBF93|nr:SMEK domain-containing protein [Vibrio diabolicus]